MLGKIIFGKFRHSMINITSFFFSVFAGYFGRFSKFLKAIDLVTMETVLFFFPLSVFKVSVH